LAQGCNQIDRAWRCGLDLLACGQLTVEVPLLHKKGAISDMPPLHSEQLLGTPLTRIGDHGDKRCILLAELCSYALNLSWREWPDGSLALA